MHSEFPLFSTPLDLSHHYWKWLLKKGDRVIDATCGNGKDTLKLANLVLEGGLVIGLDIQQQALAKTKELLSKHLNESQLKKISLFCASHEEFPKIAYEGPIQLIVYNLGYLPGGDKTLTTQTNTTLVSVKKALDLVAKGGAISITCYPGHEEGAVELKELIQFTRTLDPQVWSVCHHEWCNRTASPTLLFLQKAK